MHFGQRSASKSIVFWQLAAVMMLLAACSHETEFGAPPTVDAVLVEKAERTLKLLSNGRVLRSYPIALGAGPGPKVEQGDQRTPEGRYVIDYRNPKSDYHLALHISYPDEADRTRAIKLGVPPGGDIMIHGTVDLPEWLRWADRISSWIQFQRWRWVGTLGCIAVQNVHMDEIWRLVPDGTPVEIRP